MLKQIKKTNLPKKTEVLKHKEPGQTKFQSTHRIHDRKEQMEDELEQCDEFESQSINDDQKIDQKTSFVSNMTERKRMEKKKKIVNYLQEHRNNLPTYRQSRRNSQVIDEDDDTQNGNIQNQLQKMQNFQIKNTIFEQFIIEFNKDPERAIEKYIKQRKIIKNDDPNTIANYLLKVQGINKNALGQYFGRNDQKVMKILRSYCDLLGFKDIQFDIALRRLLSKFKLPGQAQQIQRIVWQFAQSYYSQNNDNYQNAEELFPLAYSIIMLATDAHNPKQEKKMNCQQFIKNTQRACPSIGKQYLQKVYQRIVKQKLQTQRTVYDKLPDLYMTNLKQALGFAEQLKKGTIVWKIVLKDKKFFKWNSKKCQFSKRKIFLSEDCQRLCWIDPQNQKQQPRFIWIRNITDLTIGIAQHLQDKKNIPKQCEIQFFTITTPQRTLDIRTMTSKVRSKWLNYLRSVMIQKRQEKKQKLQTHYSSVSRKQYLEQIWQSQIFPNWDQYWDYQLKKPRKNGFFKQNVRKFCYCFTRNAPAQNQNLKKLEVPLGSNILKTVWGYGLLPKIRQRLWDEIIGNSLQINQFIIQDIKKRSIYSLKLRQIQQEPDVIETAQFLITLRPDLPHVKDLIQTSKVFHTVFSNQKSRLISLTNLIHKYHFLPFYKGDRNEIQLRTQLFEQLLVRNAPYVYYHFLAIKLQTKFYLVPWFLSIFSEMFKGNFLLRIWDNFLLQGQIYLFKVGIALIKYFEIQLKMCTFYEGLKLLKFSNVQKSSIMFFEILNKEINVREEHYFEFISRRKQAMIKTRIQQIPLE